MLIIQKPSCEEIKKLINRYWERKSIRMQAYKIKTWTQSSKELAKYETSFFYFLQLLRKFLVPEEMGF